MTNTENASATELLGTRPFAQRLRLEAIVMVISAATFLASLDLFIVNLVLPSIQDAFPGHGLATTSWILNAYTIVFAAFLTPAGRFGDRYGHRTIFVLGLAVFAIASAACGLAPSLPVLVAARAIQAIGAAMLMPTSLALLLTAVSPARRATAVSIWSAIGASAAALGPPIGGALVEFSWRWVFFINLPIAALAIAFGLYLLPKTAPTSTGTPDLVGCALLIAGVGTLVWALLGTPGDGWHHATPWATLTLAAAMLALVALRSRRHSHPALDLHSLKVGPLWTSCLALLLFTTAFGAMLLANVLFLSNVWHLPAKIAGLGLVPGPAMAVVISFLIAGPLINRIGIGPVAALGSISFAVGTASWICLADLHPDYLHHFLPGQILTGTGVGLVMPSLSAVVALVLPQPRWGAGSAMVNTARQLGIAFGTAMIVLLCRHTVNLNSVQNGWWLITLTASTSAIIVAAAAIYWGNYARLHAEPHAPTQAT